MIFEPLKNLINAIKSTKIGKVIWGFIVFLLVISLVFGPALLALTAI
jgi:hypothetical protein